MRRGASTAPLGPELGGPEPGRTLRSAGRMRSRICVCARDYRHARAKGILIFAVVLGHLMARTSPWESPVLGAPMYLIYSFHMPAFVFLAGITAKSNRLPERVLNFLVLLAAVLPLMWVWM